MIFKGAQLINKELKAEMIRIYEQAETHCTRDGLKRLLEIQRPTEPESIKEYRIANQRRITRSSTESWFSMVSRIFNNSGIIVKGKSDRLTQYLEAYPFKSNRKELSFENWMLEVALRLSVLDPNGLFVIYPKKTDWANTLEMAMPQVKFFECEDIVGTYDGGVYLVKDLGKNLHEHWIISATDIIVYRDRFASGGKIEVEEIFTYNHNIGDIPIVSAMGITTVFDDELMINESFLSGSFEYWDEVINRFSDSQAVSVQHDYPIKIMTEIPCKADGCRNGHVTDSEGKVSKCSECGGRGIVTGDSPYHTLVAPESMMEGGNKREPVVFVAPQQSSIDSSYNRAMDLLKKGQEEAGLHVLDSTSAESGVAKSMRLEEKQDKLLRLASSFKMFAEQILYYYECYLVIVKESRQIPTVFVPKSLQIKDTLTLQTEAIEAPLADRYYSYLKYLSDKYNGDDMMIEVYKVALQESPILMLNQTEIDARMTAGIYSGFDLYKADVIVQTLLENYDDNAETMKNRSNEQIRRSYSEKNGLNQSIG